ncbi:phosphopantetheine-binding protein [Actinosynnema sp. CS-041913]|uniref:phosphopantetheine-binding protein n=1 Tax=Actinosynnema sp. CS-041913 TaxID=3239917 RepID=UPI003D8C9E52
MAGKEFTLDDLRRVLREAAGADESVDLDGDILDTGFEALNYESLALLETCSHIEREYGVSLDDALDADHTPRSLIDLVNARLSAAV